MNYKIYKNVKLGKNVIIEDFAVVGKPPKGKEDGELETVIGDNSIIRSGSVIYAGTKTGKNFQTGDNASIGPFCVFGDYVSVGTNSVVLEGCQFSGNVRIHALVFIAEHTEVEENSWIGPGVKTANNPYPKALNEECAKHKEISEKEGAPKIGKYVRIGANATICPFVKIGDYTIIGAGSVVTKEVSSKAVVVGNPAKIIKYIDDIKCNYCGKKPYVIK